jgi:hypothetical protein
MIKRESHFQANGKDVFFKADDRGVMVIILPGKRVLAHSNRPRVDLILQARNIFHEIWGYKGTGGDVAEIVREIESMDNFTTL